MLVTKAMRVFFAVYQEKSIKSAAEFLCLTPPPVIRMLHLTEEWFGETLFTKERNSLKPTHKAESLYKQLHPHYVALSTLDNSKRKRIPSKLKVTSPHINQSYITNFLSPFFSEKTNSISFQQSHEMHAEDDVFLSLRSVESPPHFELHILERKLSMFYQPLKTETWQTLPFLLENPVNLIPAFQETYEQMVSDGYQGECLRNDNVVYISDEFNKGNGIIFSESIEESDTVKKLPYEMKLAIFAYVNKLSCNKNGLNSFIDAIQTQ